MLDQNDLGSEKIRPMRRAEYDRLVHLGAFDGERVELIRGVMVEMTPQDSSHSEGVLRLQESLFGALRGRARIRSQSPFNVDEESVPEPDIAVVPPGDYSKAHPSSALLIVEVASSSLVKDRRIKAPLYAKARVPEYWLVNLEQEVVEVCRAPEGDSYRETFQRGRGDIVGMLAFPDVELKVDQILPTR